MAKFDTTIVIQRPIADVFAYLVKPEHYSAWSLNATEARQTSPGSVGVGTTIWFAARFMGRRMEGTLEITEYEPNKRFAVKTTTGPLPFETRYVLEPTEINRTQLDYTSEIRLTGIYKVLEPLLAARIHRQLEAGLNSMKKALEMPAPAATAA